VTSTDNTDQHEAWNGESGRRWVLDAGRRDRVLAPVADAVLRSAGARPGERVLDVGCGCGVTTLAVADAVGDGGTATGIDLSQPMLDLARRRAHDAGRTNVELIEGDAQSHALPPGVDLALSRFGTMFFADPTAAFTNIGGALRPGGRLCLATWQPLVANDWLTIPGTELLRYGTMPEGGQAGPGMFAQSEPDIVRMVLTDAGFLGISLEPVNVDLPLGAHPDEATDYLADSGVGRAVLDTVPIGDRAAALEGVRTVLADHTDETGVHLGAAIWIITATKAG
jgi:SAM-dependent methyltransferase